MPDPSHLLAVGQRDGSGPVFPAEQVAAGRYVFDMILAPSLRGTLVFGTKRQNSVCSSFSSLVDNKDAFAHL